MQCVLAPAKTGSPGGAVGLRVSHSDLAVPAKMLKASHAAGVPSRVTLAAFASTISCCPEIHRSEDFHVSWQLAA